MQMPYKYGVIRKQESELDVFSLLRQTGIFLWKDWPMDMQLAQNSEERGLHCGTCALYRLWFRFRNELRRSGRRPLLYASSRVAQCIACSEYILVILKLDPSVGIRGEWNYELHVPSGRLMMWSPRIFLNLLDWI